MLEKKNVHIPIVIFWRFDQLVVSPKKMLKKIFRQLIVQTIMR